jgi:hypothetical protein
VWLRSRWRVPTWLGPKRIGEEDESVAVHVAGSMAGRRSRGPGHGDCGYGVRPGDAAGCGVERWDGRATGDRRPTTTHTMEDADGWPMMQWSSPSYHGWGCANSRPRTGHACLPACTALHCRALRRLFLPIAMTRARDQDTGDTGDAGSTGIAIYYLVSISPFLSWLGTKTTYTASAQTRTHTLSSSCSANTPY